MKAWLWSWSSNCRRSHGYSSTWTDASITCLYVYKKWLHTSKANSSGDFTCKMYPEDGRRQCVLPKHCHPPTQVPTNSPTTYHPPTWLHIVAEHKRPWYDRTLTKLKCSEVFTFVSSFLFNDVYQLWKWQHTSWQANRYLHLSHNPAFLYRVYTIPTSDPIQSQTSLAHLLTRNPLSFKDPASFSSPPRPRKGPFVCVFRLKDSVRLPQNTMLATHSTQPGNIIVLYISIFASLESRSDDKEFWTAG